MDEKVVHTDTSKQPYDISHGGPEYQIKSDEMNLGKFTGEIQAEIPVIF